MQSFQKDIDLISGIPAVPTILDVVCRTTGMGFAAVARVTEDRWIACRVMDKIRFGLEPGGELPIESTICHEIRQHRRPVIINNVAEDPIFCHHHTPATYGLKSYISMPIIMPDDRFFGTLCAIDPNPALLDTPEIVGMFELFAELLAFHIDAAERLAASEASLSEEREFAGMRELFMGVLGHDLRGPLSAISSATGVLKMASPEPRVAKISDLIQDSVTRMTGMIEDVLDFTRVRLGDGITIERRTDAELGPVLEQVIDEVRSSSPGREIISEISLTGKVSCDPGRIGQLFSNLLGNAVVHGDKGHPIRVSAATTDGVFELSVSNYAEAIPSSKLEQLFHPFARGGGAGHQEGLGLGLYIASEIAKAHGGTLEVKSTSEQTRFTLRMPASALGS